MTAKRIPGNRLISVFPPYSPLVIKYKDVLDFKEFYTVLHDWLTEYGWSDLEEKKDHYETLYLERVDRAGMKEIIIRWRPFKNPVDTNAFVYYLDFDFHCVALMKTEIIKDGRKIKAYNGEVELKINPLIEEKYKIGFEKEGLLKMFTDLFAKRIYKKQTEVRKKELYREAYVLQNFIKQWLKLKRYSPYEGEGFFPSAAYPSHQK